MPYAALAIVVLAVFYGIYFSKMLIQRRHGIKTHQIGSRKEGSVHTVEVLMSIATFGAPAAQLVSVAFGWSLMPAGAPAPVHFRWPEYISTPRGKQEWWIPQDAR